MIHYNGPSYHHLEDKDHIATWKMQGHTLSGIGTRNCIALWLQLDKSILIKKRLEGNKQR